MKSTSTNLLNYFLSSYIDFRSKYAKKNLQDLTICQRICELILEKNHSNVNCAKKNLHNPVAFLYTCEIIQGLSHSNVKFAIKNVQFTTSGNLSKHIATHNFKQINQKNDS